MPRRGENIYKRKDGRWEGRVKKPDGKYRYVYAKTYREVKEMRNALERAGRCGESAPEAAASASEQFEAWLNGDLSDRVKPSTYESYYRCLKKYVIPFFQNAGNDHITEQGTAQLVRRISDDTALSQSYKRKIISILKTALREILRDSARYAAVTKAIRLPKAGNAAVSVFSVKEQRMIENAVIRSPDKRAIGILLCFYTGIRLGELCALKWGDLDFEAGTLSVERTVSRVRKFKGGENGTVLLVGTPKSRNSIRKIPLPDFLLQLAKSRKLCSEAETHYVLSDSDLPLDPRTYQKLFKRILRCAGVKERKFHAIRHTFATRALELGVDIKTLSEMLGHANVSITLNIYAHSMMEQKRIAIDKLNELHTEISSFPVMGAVMTA